MNIQENIILAPFTTFGIGGEADFFCKAISAQEIIDAVRWANEKNLEYFLLGSGANILIGDRGFRGLVIKNEAKKYQISNSPSSRAKRGDLKKNEIASYPPETDPRNDEVFLTAEGGSVIADLIKLTQEKGLSGLEHFAGIPSTLGGALWQNLHFLSPNRSTTVFIGDIIAEAEVLKENGEVIRVQKEYFHFDYDYSSLHDTKDIVLAATLSLTPEKNEIIQERIDANLKWRAEKHPEYATKCSAGSVFKKIPARNASHSDAGGEGGAGRFIERVGLKGYKFGGAQISPKHANFIVNTGNATAADVRSVIAVVQEKVKQDLQLDLQTEIRFIGEF